MEFFFLLNAPKAQNNRCRLFSLKKNMRKQGQRKTSHGLLILQDKMRWGCNSYLIFTRKSPKYQLRHHTVESATVRWRILITHFGEKICWRWLWGKIRENYVIKDVICSENHSKICNQITFRAKIAFGFGFLKNRPSLRRKEWNHTRLHTNYIPRGHEIELDYINESL